LDERDPYLPFGDHVLEATGKVELVGEERSLLIVEFVVMQSNTVPQEDWGKVTGCWKRSLGGSFKGKDKIISDTIGRLVCPLMGMGKDNYDAGIAARWIGELPSAGTLEGQSLKGKRVGATVYPNKKGNTDKQGKAYPDYVFHVL
jgi:hypothetical protein